MPYIYENFPCVMPGKEKFIRLILYLQLLALLLLGFPFFVSAQSDPDYWTLEPIPIADELGSNTVRSIVEDQQGYLWLATNTGIARYDGYTFKNYPAIPGDTTTLNDGRPDFAFVDHLGVLWVGTRRGINRYLPECDCFKQYNAGSAPPNTVPKGGVNWITEDENKQMWIAAQYGGLYRYDRKGDRFERFLYGPEDQVDLSADQIRVLQFDRAGQLWIGTGETSVSSYTGGGLIRFNPASGEAKRYLHDPEDKNSLLDNRVSALLQDSRGRIWVGSCNNGLYRYDAEKDHFIRMTSDSTELYAREGISGPWTSCPHIKILQEDQWGGIWVGNYAGGLYRFDPAGKAPRLFEHRSETTTGLTNNLFWAFLQDSQGRFWLGNIIGGLYKIDPWKNKFRTRFRQKIISGVFESSAEPNVIWIAIWDEGIYRWNRNTNETELLQLFASKTDGPNDKRIKVIFEDAGGKLWLGHEWGLSSYERSTGQLTHFSITTDEEPNRKSASIYAIHEDKRGYLWLGSWGNGLYEFDKSTGTSKQYLPPATGNQENNKYNQSIYAICEDLQGRLWLGTWMGGLYQFDRNTASFKQYLAGIGIRTILKSQPGRFWLGTGDNGLIEFAPETGVLRTFTTQEGLPGNKVYTILEDEEHVLWLSTNRGICSFDTGKEIFTNYDRSDGLPGLQFMDFSALKASDGTFYFGSNEGLAIFQPEQLAINEVPPKTHIQDVKIFDRSYRDTSLALPHYSSAEVPAQLVLPHHQNELTFEYVGLHFTAPESNRYRYRLLPYEAHWIEAGTRRSARYTNLKPGIYRFEVLAANSDNQWAATPATLDIRIRSPWWNTGWAFLLYILIATLSLWLVYRFRKQRRTLRASLKREQEEAARLRELDEFKNRFYSNITHEFRTPLTVIQGLAREIEAHPNREISQKIHLISRNSDQLLRLINQMLDLSKLEAGKLEPEYVQGDIIKYLSVLVESFYPIAESKKLRLSFDAHRPGLLTSYDPEICRQIIINLLSNAIKFTPEYGIIKVVARVIGDQDTDASLEVAVSDNGRGIPLEKLDRVFDRFYQINSSPPANGAAKPSSLSGREQEWAGTGLGLALVKEWLALLGGSIHVQSELGKGSTFTCRIPLRADTDTMVADSVPGHIFHEHTTFTDTDTTRPVNKHRKNLPLILLVEDNQDVLYYLRTCLENHYRLLGARNGKAGLEMAFEHSPDIVISDVMMPEMDGFALCQTLKTDERSSHIPVVLLTAKVTQADKIAGLTHGADVYLAKPFQKNELLIRLSNLLELRRQMQQQYQPDPNITEAAEDPFLQKTRQIIEKHLNDPDFGVVPLSRALGMSRVQVHRKLKALIDVSTSQYIRLIRLQRAYELLKDPALTVSEVAYQVGFKDPAHFSRSFSQQFGVVPSEIR